jgi:tripartite ATP-independent periplasmic transporter solute receptor, DctP family
MRRTKLLLFLVLAALLVLSACSQKSNSGGNSGSSASGGSSAGSTDSSGSSGSSDSSASSGSESQEPAKPKADPIHWKLGHTQPVGGPYQKAAELFKQLVEERSEGQLIIDIFPSSQLGNGRDMVEGLQINTIQIYTGTLSVTASFAPKMGIYSLPYLFRDVDHAHKVVKGEIGKELSKELEAVGILNVGHWESGFRHFTNNVRPIKSAADLKGLKMRVLESEVFIELMKQMETTPVPMPVGELYSALEQKAVDGEENPLGQIVNLKFYEVQKYLTLDGHIYDVGAILVSKIAFDALDPELQQIVLDAAAEASEYNQQLSFEAEQNYVDFLKEQGMEVEENPDLESFRQAAAPVYDKFADKYGADLIERIRAVQ